MKSFAHVYNNSKKQVLDEKARLYESQKAAVVKVLKENYMITTPISSLPMDEQKDFAKKLFQYWSPKTGINRAGQKLISENEITLTPSSNKADIKLYIEKRTRQHIDVITNAYRQNNISAVMESFKNDIEPMIQKTLKESFVNNIVWDIVEHRIKTGI